MLRLAGDAVEDEAHALPNGVSALTIVEGRDPGVGARAFVFLFRRAGRGALDDDVYAEMAAPLRCVGVLVAVLAGVRQAQDVADLVQLGGGVGRCT